MNVLEHLPVLIIVIVLSGALLCTFVSMFHRIIGKALVVACEAAAFVCAVLLFKQVMETEGHEIHYAVGNWQAPLGIEFVVDPLNALMVCIIMLVGLCTCIYCISYIRPKKWMQSGGFFTLLGLLTVGLCGMTLTGDVFNLYVFLEIASISCYGLIAMGGKRSIMSAFRYLLIGTIGASFYLIGIGMLYSMTGSLNMADLSELLQSQMNNELMIPVCVCLIVAFGIKMAIFPFHAWQPDAYSYAHPGASPLISGAMSKVPAIAMIRFFFFIFGIDHLIVQHATLIIGIIGAIGMIYGSLFAMAQKDFRRMLAYSSVAQLGYIALGVGIANDYGVTGSYLHILNHMFMKGGLFFAIGGIQYRYGIVNINQFGQLHKKMPWTCFTIVVGAMAMVGIPPTGGFFSKWYLMLGAMDKGYYIYIAVLIVSSLMNAIYFLRVVEKIFISPEARIHEVGEHPKHAELPLPILIPIILFGIGMIAMGIYNGSIVDHVVLPVLKGVL
ncbi:MAG: hypothetical protein K6G01_01640 [Eubacterium sp.]|nr:hypothetical protein [Eubacterium sp.]